MFPAPFDYERATSVAEALDLLDDRADEEVEFLAGGHSLVPAMKERERTPDVVVDLDVPELSGISVLPDRTVVGALTTYATVAEAETLPENAPLLAETAGEVGDVQIRNMGTIGGNLAEAHPGADPPAAVLANDATVLLRNRDGKREVPAPDFFRGDGETAIERGELLAGVRVPHTDDAGVAYAKKTHPATGYAMVGVAAVVDVDGPGGDGEGTVSTARVAATGAVDRAVRLPSVEDALVGESPDSDAIDAAATEALTDVEEDRLRSDAYASGSFRGDLLETYVARALESAAERAVGEAPTA